MTLTVNPGDPNEQPPTAGTHPLDVRGRRADQPSILPHDCALEPSVADDDDHRDHGTDSGQYGAGTDQHAGAVHVAARVSGHVRKRRHGAGDAD